MNIPPISPQTVIDLVFTGTFCNSSDPKANDMGDFLFKDFIIKITEQYKLDEIAPVYFSPAEYLFAPVTLAELIMENRAPVKMQVQLHRILWPEISRGV